MWPLFLLFAAVPLAVDFNQELPYEPIKILLIEAGAVVGIATAFTIAFTRRKQGIVRRLGASLNVIDWALVVWLVVLALSTFFSVDPYASFWGSAERGTGFVYYWCLTAIYFVIRFVAESRDWRLFLRLTCAVASLVSAYGILQWLGIDASALKHAFRLYGRSGPTRAFSTFGHPNFLGVYLALWLPFAWFLWRNEKRKSYRALAAVSAVMSALALAMTYSRGAWFGAIAGGAVLSAFRLNRSGHWCWRIPIGMCCAAAVIVCLIFWQAPRLESSANSFAFRLGSSFDFSKGSTLARTAEWKYALRLMPAHPFLGYGLDTYIRYAGQRIKDPAERNRDFSVADPSLADRLHNFILDILWSSGLAGLLALVTVLGAIFLRIRKLFIQNTESRLWVTVLCSSLTAYLVCNLTGFDFSVSGLWFFIILAGIASAEVIVDPLVKNEPPG